MSRRAGIARSLPRLRLFVSSYAAAFLIIAIRSDNGALRAVMIALAVGGVIDTFWLLRSAARSMEPTKYAIVSEEDVGAEVGGYLATYLLPFVTVADPSGRDLAAYSIFMITLAVIYVKSDLVRVNPTLYLLGRRVNKVTLADSSTRYLVTKNATIDGESVNAVPLAGVLIEAG